MVGKKALDKSRIPAQFRDPYDRVMDRCHVAELRGSTEHTVFYDPEVRQFLENVLHKECSAPWDTLGGLPEAEYRIIRFNPQEQDPEDFPLRVLTVKPLRGNSAWSHRDVLGAVLGAGIKRDRIGDILLHSWGAQIICLKEAAAILEWQLESISRDKVAVEITETDSLVAAEADETLVTVFISGLRVDALIAAVWNLSRGDAQGLVRSEKVKVNYKTVSGASAQISEGDMISVRGYGRFVLKEIQGATRKDRLRALISKYSG